MAFRSAADYAAKAAEAAQPAAVAPTAQLISGWQRVAETYRRLAYQRLAFGPAAIPRR